MPDCSDLTERLCISITGETAEECIDMMRTHEVKFVEHRMDFMSRIERLEEIYDGVPASIIATCRPTRLGGHFEGSETEREEHLIAALRAGSSYVDVEMQTNHPMFNRVKEAALDTNSGLILSKHYWDGTPSVSSLQGTMKKMANLKPDIIKIVTTAVNREDCSRILQLYLLDVRRNSSLIAFSMGQLGKITRVCSLFLGAPFGYVSHDMGKKAAPGQMTLSEMHSILEVLT